MIFSEPVNNFNDGVSNGDEISDSSIAKMNSGVELKSSDFYFGATLGAGGIISSSF